jgi:hypothetical protein
MNEGKKNVAFNVPAFAQLLGPKKFMDQFFTIYDMLAKDKLVPVREHVAAGIHEVRSNTSHMLERY